jgi:hypothetical protein
VIKQWFFVFLVFCNFAHFTQYTPSYQTPCVANTQVCQQPFVPPDKSCGLGPPYVGFYGYGQGLAMQTSGGYLGCGNVQRMTTLNVLCAYSYGRADKTVDYVQECMYFLNCDSKYLFILLDPGCHYTIYFYANDACGSYYGPTPTSKPRNPINPTDQNVLESLYSSTLGENWIYNSNWMTSENPCDTSDGWYGVTCEQNSKYSFVKGIFLNQNNLQGTLPDDLNDLSHLQELVLDHNNIRGTLPMLDSLSLLTLHLSSNKLSGTIPPNFTLSSTNLISLLMGNNQLSGSLPSILSSFQKLNTLDLSHNNLNSSLDEEVCNVKHFNLYGNEWSCPLPSCCGKSSLQNCGPTCLPNVE